MLLSACTYKRLRKGKVIPERRGRANVILSGAAGPRKRKTSPSKSRVGGGGRSRKSVSLRLPLPVLFLPFLLLSSLVFSCFLLSSPVFSCLLPSYFSAPALSTSSDYSHYSRPLASIEAVAAAVGGGKAGANNKMGNLVGGWSVLRPWSTCRSTWSDYDLCSTGSPCRSSRAPRWIPRQLELARAL